MTMPYDRNAQQAAAAQYLRQKIEQAGPVEQVLLLLDGAIRFLQQARVAIEARDVQARHNANKRAMDIVSHLLSMVNPETGGDAAKSLFGIYSSLIKRMMQIDFENSVAACDEVTANLRSLRTGLAQGLAMQQGIKPATVVAAPTADVPVTGVRRDAVA